MTNPANFSVVHGNVAANPSFFQNKDGGYTIKGAVYARNNFKSRDGSVGSKKVPFTGFISAGQDSPTNIWRLIDKGADVTLMGHLEQAEYVKSGETEKTYELVFMVETVNLNESKTEAAERRARQAAKAQAPAAAQTQPQNGFAGAPAAAPVQGYAAPAPVQAPVQGYAPAPVQGYAAPAAPQMPQNGFMGAPHPTY